MAILWYLGMASDVDDFPHCPLILSYCAVIFYLCSQFEDSREEIDDKLLFPFLQRNATTNQGMISFCEATKVDLQLWYNSKNNRNKHMTKPLNTQSLLYLVCLWI